MFYVRLFNAKNLHVLKKQNTKNLPPQHFVSTRKIQIKQMLTEGQKLKCYQKFKDKEMNSWKFRDEKINFRQSLGTKTTLS